MASIWINGTLADEATAGVSVRDFGLLHAAGVFTTMRADAGSIFGIDRHLARLRRSCETLGVPLPYPDEELVGAAATLLEANGLRDARLRLTVTRGQPIDDPVHGPAVRPTVFLTATLLETYPAELYAKGMTVLAYDEFKLNPYDPQAGHKTLDYLSRLGALREAQRRGANEALLFNVHNYLQGATVANVFLVTAGALVTPPTTGDMEEEAVRGRTPYPRSNVLPGVMRAAVLDAAAKESLVVERRAVTIDEVLGADELFLTNSIMGVMPACRVERRAIGDEKPGPVTRRMMATVEAR